MERLRRKLEGLKAAESDRAEEGESKLIRLPHHPRRMTEDAAERPRKTWRSEGGSAFDAPPTRPVTRSELQGETGAWPADAGSQDDQGGVGQDASIIDFGASRRKRAGRDAPAAGIRRMAKPRRIGPDTP
ncbi:hypothetical protein ACIBCN_27850 [Nocardia sp. NPDC051052]|uniref:hypothetical protein n=1 Tax=Nocardia sp. NPDC051052 TaxID=3364322 RepID=UPI0037961EE3